MRLSSLIDHLVKEQGRMKDAVSSIRSQNTHSINESSRSHIGDLRRSQSFDVELQK